jgi:CO dehydrogenase maturation factor
MEKSIKLAVTGKGGVGKTTVSSLLCKAFIDSGYSVLAVDADPDANLATAIGFKEEIDIQPLTEMKELIEERTGAKPGSVGSFFKLNPKVDDLPEKLWKEKNGIKLLRMGTVKKGGGGCICPESAMLKTMVQNLLLFRKEAVIMDMEAGIEHLGRATAQAVNPLIVVVEPGKRSMETARQIKSLAEDIQLRNIAIIANKVRSQKCTDFLKKEAGDIPILGFLPFNDDVLKADMEGLPPWEVCPEALEIIKEIARKLVEQKAV